MRADEAAEPVRLGLEQPRLTRPVAVAAALRDDTLEAAVAHRLEQRLAILERRNHASRPFPRAITPRLWVKTKNRASTRFAEELAGATLGARERRLR